MSSPRLLFTSPLVRYSSTVGRDDSAVPHTCASSVWVPTIDWSSVITPTPVTQIKRILGEPTALLE